MSMYQLDKHDAAIPAQVASSGCWVLARGGDLGPRWVRLQGLWSTIPGVRKHLSYSTDSTSSVSIEVGTMPYAVGGGTGWVKSKPPKATHRVPEFAGSTLRMDKTQSYTFSDGFDLKDMFGISLAATTGYSKAAEVKYHYIAQGIRLRH
jgi:hypothetical protein